MANASKRVFIENARLSFPALDAPREGMNEKDKKKYQATFLMDKDNPSIQRLKEAIVAVAREQWHEKADSVLKNAAKLPLRDGDTKDNVAGYAGKVFISARSERTPDLRDANPKVRIEGEKAIREKFVAGYRVNGFVDIFAYEYNGMRGISAGLVAVQFKAYDDAFGGNSALSDDAFPDCSGDAAASSSFDDIPF